MYQIRSKIFITVRLHITKELFNPPLYLPCPLSLSLNSRRVHKVTDNQRNETQGEKKPRKTGDKKKKKKRKTEEK